MPALENPKWEKFAKEVARGKTQRAAYKACGYIAKDADSAASDLAHNPKVKQRIKELTTRVTDKAIERAALSKSWVLEKLRENAEKALEAPHESLWEIYLTLSLSLCFTVKISGPVRTGGVTAGDNTKADALEKWAAASTVSS